LNNEDFPGFGHLAEQDIAADPSRAARCCGEGLSLLDDFPNGLHPVPKTPSLV
jgi:hypothetical protein